MSTTGTARAPEATPPGRQAAPDTEAGYLTLEQAAGYLACSTKTVRRWAQADGLPHYYVRRRGCTRGVLLFRKGQIDRWLRSCANGLAD